MEGREGARRPRTKRHLKFLFPPTHSPTENAFRRRETCVGARELMACAPRIKCPCVSDVVERDCAQGRATGCPRDMDYTIQLYLVSITIRVTSCGKLFPLRDKTKFDTRARSLKASLALSFSFRHPYFCLVYRINLSSCIACASGSRLARRPTSAASLFIRESNYASSSLGFIATESPAAATTALRFNATLHLCFIVLDFFLSSLMLTFHN